MIPILLHFGPITIYSYGLMVALGFIAADLATVSEFKRRGYDPQIVSTLVLWIAISAMVGSRILDIINNWSNYAANPISMITPGAGFVFYGGFIGAILVSFILARYFKIRWLTLADMCAPGIAIGHGIGRIGCQLSGDGDWGLPSNAPWAMAYRRAIVGWNGRTVVTLGPNGQLLPAPGCNDSGCEPWVRVHPAPIYETILYTGVFLILWSLRRRLNIEGQVFYVYLMLA